MRRSLRCLSFSLWTPLSGVVAGALLLGDRVTPWLGAAVLLVAAGIFLVNRRTTRAERGVRSPTARGR